MSGMVPMVSGDRLIRMIEDECMVPMVSGDRLIRMIEDECMVFGGKRM